ncbi:hypothetical protein [Hymenobacter rubidus]|uniref:hypothetical protein n=1 Tax=Hymenobacter rubidus TaxID=1441626 RepID=UPI00191FBABA|nr:hypothetical protein [Hymenobacter rubidus]
MQSIQHLIANFAIVPVVVAVLVGLVRYRRLEPEQRYLLALVSASLLMEIASRTLHVYKRPNLFLAPIDTTIEFCLLALIYRRVLRPSLLSRLAPLLIAGFVLGSALTYSPRLDTVQFSPVQHFIECVLVLAFVAGFFHHEISQPVVTKRLEREPAFWISTAALLYFLSNSLIFLSSNYVLTLSLTLSRRIWAIHGLIYIFSYVLYIIALAISRPKPLP